ncbi:hypothetical protein K1719_027343 [Acacia pycnantha]|nr:hypothetical protein K1719_027343 [Acacia pycnantha]
MLNHEVHIQLDSKLCLASSLCVTTVASYITLQAKINNTLHWADRAKEIRAKTCDATEDVVPVAETKTDQAKLVLELQKGNRELRMQLAKLQQKQMILQAQSLAANTSSTPPSATSSLFTPPTSAQTIRKNEA